MGASARCCRLAHSATSHGVAVSNHLVNTEARFALPETSGRWLEVADGEQIERVVDTVRETLPSGHLAAQRFYVFTRADSKPDNIFLITDGLPTQGKSAPRRNTVSGPARLKHYRDALRNLPNNVPVNVVLSPMEGDPAAASEFWKLAQETGGSFHGTRGGLALMPKRRPTPEISLSFSTSFAAGLALLSCS